MQKITRIIVANDGLQGMAHALTKAAKLEHFTGAKLRVVTVTYDNVAEEPSEVLPEEQRVQLIEALKAAERQGLRQITDSCQPKVAELDAQVLWSKTPKETILSEVSHSGADLLIKPVSEHHPLADYLHAPLDWALMREAPCAVLVSRRPNWDTPTVVVAAVDVTDDRHTALTREILLTAATVAKLLAVPLHIATAFPSLGQRVDDLQVAMDYEGIKADMRANRDKAMTHWIETLHLDVAERHVIEGKPATAIPDLANQLRATVTVVGTAARRGLGKLLIGNTAEDMVARITGDILTVREPWS